MTALPDAGVRRPVSSVTRKVVASVKLLRAMPDSLLFHAHSAFADILENAERLGSESYERVCSYLHILAGPKGARFVSPGKPDPFYVAQARKAAELAERYADVPGREAISNAAAKTTRSGLCFGLFSSGVEVLDPGGEDAVEGF